MIISLMIMRLSKASLSSDVELVLACKQAQRIKGLFAVHLDQGNSECVKFIDRS